MGLHSIWCIEASQYVLTELLGKFVDLPCPAVYKEYPFTAEGVAAAQVDQASGKTTGKLIIKIAD